MAQKAPLDSQIEIVTPENIAFHHRVAGPFRRLPAFLVDVSIRVVGMTLLVLLLSFLTFMTGLPTIALSLVVWFVLDWFYGGIFESWMNGQTPGKRMLGIRVVTVDGQPISGLQAVMRNILRSVDSYPLLSGAAFGGMEALYIVPTFSVGLIIMMMSSRFQRLGDWVCGTMVIIEERHWLTGVARIEDPRAAQLATYIPANYVISRSLARVLAVYVERRRFFSPARKSEVARHLAQPLLVEFGLPPDTNYDLLLCALYHRAFVAERAGDTVQQQPAGMTVGPVMQQPAPPFRV